MGLFITQLINGLALGMLYGMAALGFTMVYKALGYLNFSHSTTMTIGALCVYAIVTTTKTPFLIAILIVIGIMLLYGYGIEKILFKRFYKASSLTFMLVSISLSTVLTNVCQLIFGAQPKGISNAFPSINLDINGVQISVQKICIFAIAVGMLIVLNLFFKTKFGLALRLASEDSNTAGMMGVNFFATRAATFAITAALGGLSGMLLAPLYSVSIDLGSKMALKVFIASVIGGLGNFGGAIVGGILTGLVETMGTTYVSSAYKDLIVYVMGIVVLAIFPYGIFRRVKTRV